MKTREINQPAIENVAIVKVSNTKAVFIASVMIFKIKNTLNNLKRRSGRKKKK